MKKLLAIAFCLLCLLITNKNLTFLDVINAPDNAVFVAYTKGPAYGENLIACGNGFMIISDISKSDQILDKNKNVLGQSVSFSGVESDYADMKVNLKLKIIAEEEIENIKTFYGYTEKLNDYITIDGNRVNIQVALRDGVITIGTPVILGSY